MTPRLRRRRMLAATALTAAGALVGLGAGEAGWFRFGQPGVLLRSQCRLPTPFQIPLPIPPVLTPIRASADTDYYEITQHLAEVNILPDQTTTMWTYAGSFPGPTVVSRAGRRTVVRHINRLPHPVVVHLHGGHTPHHSDGYPLDLILPTTNSTAPTYPGHGMALSGSPGVTTIGHRDYTYPINQPAATLWYHDHCMGFTGPAVWYGLAGFHLVGDTVEDGLPLPRADRDIPIMITDRAFTHDGQLHYPLADPDMRTPGVTGNYTNGVLGDVVLVNGAPWPVLPVQRQRYRLRLLNASNARRYRLRLDPPPAGGSGFTQIGGDGGLLAAPISHDTIPVAPAERFDIVIDFHRWPAGTRVRLINALGTDTTANVMRFDIADGPAPTDHTCIPATSPTSPLPTPPPRQPSARSPSATTPTDGASTATPANPACPSPNLASATPKSGDSSPTSTTPSTPTSTRSASWPATTARPAAATSAGKTPSPLPPPKPPKSSFASPTTPAATCSTATTSNMKTWP